MAKSLVITEKPSVARDIAGALGGFREEDGWFESDAYVVTFAVGHLFELLSHRVLRYASGFLHLGLLATSIALWATAGSTRPRSPRRRSGSRSRPRES
jgi:DNA topoisomerase-3